MSTIAPLQRRRLACAIDLEESAVLLATAEYELDNGGALEHSPRRLDARVDLELLRAREALSSSSSSFRRSSAASLPSSFGLRRPS